jgi:hypothetical protein
MNEEQRKVSKNEAQGKQVFANDCKELEPIAFPREGQES